MTAIPAGQHFGFVAVFPAGYSSAFNFFLLLFFLFLFVLFLLLLFIFLIYYSYLLFFLLNFDYFYFLKFVDLNPFRGLFFGSSALSIDLPGMFIECFVY